MALSFCETLEAYANHLDQLAGLSINLLTNDLGRAFTAAHLAGRHDVATNSEAESRKATAAADDGVRLQFDDVAEVLPNRRCLTLFRNIGLAGGDGTISGLLCYCSRLHVT